MTAKLKNKEIVAYLKKEFPKFNKSVLSMCSHWEYGCSLSEDAVRTLHEIYPEYKCPQKPSSQVKHEVRKKPENRTKTHRLTLRLDDESYSKFKSAFDESECKTVQEFMSKTLEESYDN